MRAIAATLLAVLVAAAAAAAAAPASARLAFGHGEIVGWTLVRAPRPPAAHVIAYVEPGQSVALHEAPSGATLEHVGATTPFGSPRALAVSRRVRGRWLAVTSPELGNGRVGWIDARAGGLRYGRTRLEITVDLSRRELVLRRGNAVRRRVSVAVGRPASPTPTGRFSVTDKLSGPAYSAYYGCCILALSATQPNLPAGWSGGDRIAIHGTPSPSDFGRAVSAGCVHAPDAALRYLMRVVPLGTPVVIHP
jgi:lipoprotein-anchoring transpeptidase ErfK/SrfK